MNEANHKGICAEVICISNRVAMTRGEAYRRAARWRRLLFRSVHAGRCPLCGTWHTSRTVR